MNPKSKKYQVGFTLVEVIVVAIIVAAMAAVAVPLYLGYVESSRRNAAANAAGSIASFCGSCVNSGGTLPAAIPANRSLICTNAATGNTTIQVPADITVTLVPGSGGVPDGNGGTTPVVARGVTANHVSFTAGTVTYNY